MKKSESIKELAAAFSKAQGEMNNPHFDSVNPHFKSKYASLAAVRNAVIPVLTKHGLSLAQHLTATGTGVMCGVILMHSSGEIMEFEPLEVPATKTDAQGVVSAATYAKRTTLQAIACVVGDEDDDAEAATGRGQAAQAAPVSHGTGGGGAAQPAAGGTVAGKKAAPAPYSADDEGSMRGRLVDLAAVWAHHKKITVPDAIKEFSIFHSKDRKTKELAYKSDGSPLWAFKTDAKDLTGKWLLIALEKAKELTKELVHEEDNMIPPDLFPET